MSMRPAGGRRDGAARQSAWGAHRFRACGRPLGRYRAAGGRDPCRRYRAGQGIEQRRPVACRDGADSWGLLMLYWLAEWVGFPGALNFIRYLSFRSGAAVATAPLIGRWVDRKRVVQGKSV